jgi:hypothetical protein
MNCSRNELTGKTRRDGFLDLPFMQAGNSKAQVNLPRSEFVPIDNPTGQGQNAHGE